MILYTFTGLRTVRSTGSTVSSAMKLHRDGDIDQAMVVYRQLVDGKINDKRIYTNLAALLRIKGEVTEAGKVIQKGLNLVDSNSPIMLNTLGNCLRDLGRYSEAIQTYRKALKNQPGYYDAQLSIVGTLYEAGYKSLSDRCLWSMFKFYGHTEKGILNQIIIREVEKSNADNRPINPRLSEIFDLVDSLANESDSKLPMHWYLTAQLCCDTGKVKESIEFYNKAVVETKNIFKQASNSQLKEKAKNLYTVSSWNFSCQLLRNGEMELGWKLYDHGLNTPAKALKNGREHSINLLLIQKSSSGEEKV